MHCSGPGRTTLNSQGGLSSRNKRAIQAAIDRAIHVVVASGRPAEALPAEITEIPGIRYAVVSNGASVWDLRKKERIQEYKLAPESVEQLLAVSAKAASDWGIEVAYEIPVNGAAYAQASYVEDPSATEPGRKASHISRKPGGRWTTSRHLSRSISENWTV